ncbi:MAG: glycosyltransferase family protein [Parachlamydiaceae bacterium]|nr:glycosyltransferase family protein [Parachlamydiaceae bacterium]
MENQPKIVAIIQARQGSTRLPGKSMKEVLLKPLLGYLLDRITHAKTINEVVVATTSLENDNVIASYCQKNSISCFRGDAEDVLGRYLAAAKIFSADIIVRITGDCPLIDPKIIDRVVTHYHNLTNSQEIDYTSNTLIRTYPRGMDVEVFSFKALELAAESAVKGSDREHVTSFIYSHPGLFKLANVVNENNDSRFRWTVDTDEDFQLVKKIIEAVYPNNNLFTYDDLLRTMNENPDWFQINSLVEQKKE